MTTYKTPELHELATDPQAFDIVRARLDDERGKYTREIASMTSKLHVLAGDKKSYRNTRVPVWGLSDLEAERHAQRAAAHGDPAAKLALTLRAGEQAMLEAIDHERSNMDMVYMRQGNRWTRFFPSITKSQPHIHRSLTCRTLHATTVMRWAPELSGKTDSQAVAELDEAMCSVCFPDAPVSLHNYVSRRSQAEQAERQAAKNDRAAKALAKNLDGSEIFRDRRHDRVTTVAACKDLIRKAVEEAVELDYWTTHCPPGWDAEQIARRRRNTAESLEEARKDAAEARRVLVAREAAHVGWGMTAEAIDFMIMKKDKSARKEWDL